MRERLIELCQQQAAKGAEMSVVSPVDQDLHTQFAIRSAYPYEGKTQGYLYGIDEDASRYHLSIVGGNVPVGSFASMEECVTAAMGRVFVCEEAKRERAESNKLTNGKTYGAGINTEDYPEAMLYCPYDSN